ncbi:MBL fold metallo-hydrolase [Alcaligenaceae bacterium]|nr:MBL fold metallo-hydrolase [Alcaligenaceae bacterium]
MKTPLFALRRKGRLAAMILAAALGAVSGCPAAFAQVPAMQASQAPGYYRMMIGGFEVTALYDGSIPLGVDLLKGAGSEELARLIEHGFVPVSPNGVQTAVNAYLVHTGKNLILVDAGAATCLGPTLGAVSRNIEASGYSVAQVDAVLLTHLHGDHACGIVGPDGAPAFPNATLHVAEDEAAFWLNTEIAAQAPQDAQPFFKMAQAAVAPYRAAGKLKRFKTGERLMPGVEAVPLHGHTPGHGGYMFASDGQAMLIWGDVIHSHAVQFVRPDVSIEFDTDPQQAIASRRQVLADAVKQKYWIAGAHLPFPGIGHVRHAGERYEWIPAEYAPLPAN